MFRALEVDSRAGHKRYGVLILQGRTSNGLGAMLEGTLKNLNDERLSHNVGANWSDARTAGERIRQVASKPGCASWVLSPHFDKLRLAPVDGFVKREPATECRERGHMLQDVNRRWGLEGKTGMA